MKVTVNKIEIVRFEYRQERGDKDLGTCLWAFFDVDAPKGTITIQGDRGHYAHTWPERDGDFWKLCVTMDGSYMMHKMTGKARVTDSKLEQIWDECIQPEVVKYLGGDA